LLNRRALGLTANRSPARTLRIADVVRGNEWYREEKIPEFGEPVPLLNPAVHQDEPITPTGPHSSERRPPSSE